MCRLKFNLLSIFISSHFAAGLGFIDIYNSFVIFITIIKKFYYNSIIVLIDVKNIY